MTTEHADRLLRHAGWHRERQNSTSPVSMTIESRVPSKWRFVDLETGDVWRWRMPNDKPGAGPFIRASVAELIDDLSRSGEAT